MLLYILALSPALLKDGAGDFYKTVSSDSELRQNLLRKDHTFRMRLNEITSHMQQNLRVFWQ
jgi:hypothetical protein